jgi:hypothetical protein
MSVGRRHSPPRLAMRSSTCHQKTLYAMTAKAAPYATQARRYARPVTKEVQPRLF